MNCPVCEAEIKILIPPSGELYYDCPECFSSLLLKNGQCELLSESEPPLEEAEALNPESQIEPSQTETTQETRLETESESESSSENDSDRDSRVAETQVPEIDEEQISPEDSYVFSEQSKETPLSDDQEPPDTELNKEDFSDLEEFASKESQKGAYLYELTLSEINSKDSKEKVLKTLNDSALGLVLEKSDLQKLDEKGWIALQDLSPIHVYVILQALMGQPLKIHWSQRHIAEPKK